MDPHLIATVMVIGVMCAMVTIVLAAQRTSGRRVNLYARALGFEAKDLARAEGTLQGRPVSVVESQDRTLSVWIGLDHPPALQITRDGLVGMLERALGVAVTSGDRAFDGRFVVAAPGDRARARAAVDEGFKQVVKRLFDGFGVTEIDTTHQPFLYKDKHLFGDRGILHAQVQHLDPKNAPALLARLDELAKLLEGVPLHVITLGGERRAERSASGSPRCAWCHADITGSEPDLVACEKCSTVLHEGCWAEQGGCPVMGCASKTAERERRKEG
jgi:hypothetical protein